MIILNAVRKKASPQGTTALRAFEQKMDGGRWITVLALTLLLAEGVALSFFPRQFKELLTESDPRWLQIAGVVETLLAAALLAGIVVAGR